MVPIAEQETVIQFNREDKGCTIWTSDSTMMTKLDRLCKTSEYYTLVKETKTKDGDTAGRFYKLSDKKMLSFRGTKREYSEEEKAALAERLKNMRNKQ